MQFYEINVCQVMVFRLYTVYTDFILSFQDSLPFVAFATDPFVAVMCTTWTVVELE